MVEKSIEYIANAIRESNIHTFTLDLSSDCSEKSVEYLANTIRESKIHTFTLYLNSGCSEKSIEYKFAQILIFFTFKYVQ